MTKQQAFELLDAENDRSASETFNGSLRPGDFFLSATKAGEYLIENGCDEEDAFAFADTWCESFEEHESGDADEDPRCSGHGNSLSNGGY